MLNFMQTHYAVIPLVLACALAFMGYELMLERKRSRQEQDHHFWMAAAMNLFMFEYDVRRDNMRLSDGCAYLLQLPPIIDKYKKFISRTDRHAIKQSGEYLQKAMDAEGKSVLLEIPRDDGSKGIFRVSCCKFYDHGDYGMNTIMGLFADVTDEMREKNKLREEAEMDALTQVYNRGTIRRMIGRLLSEPRGERHEALIMLDVDKFKTINDSLGHPIGDKTLKMLANVLKKNLRQNDIVGRLGGDEFCLYLRDITDMTQLHEICDRLNKSVAAELNAEVIGIDVTISIGCARVHEGDDMTSAYGRADEALYQSKEKGRNTYSILE